MEIVLCEREFSTHSQITGLLIRYSNGNQASVGEFRLDRAGTTLRVDGSQELCLGFARTEFKHPYLAKAELFPPADRASY